MAADPRPAPLALVLLLGCAAPAPGPAPTPAPAPAVATVLDPGVVEELTRCIEHELETKDLGALSIAVVEGAGLVWAEGWGTAQPGELAGPDTVYRVGSVTKLFTDLALMRLVEQGRLDLDAPVRSVLPGFLPENPFRDEITLRQLTCHRSGLVREPPVGHYFDPTEPSLEETVHSLSRARLVCAPGTRTKYSNAGIAVLGRVLEVAHGRSFESVIRREVLDPLGMEGTSLRLDGRVEERLAHGRMWTYDGRTFAAPTFELGMAPAGNLYASMPDLAKLLVSVLGDGSPLLERATLQRMLEPTLDGEGRRTSFGIGFAVGELDGRRRCGHGGAVYGHSTSLAFLPDEGIGVAVACSTDVSNTVMERIANHALRAVLAAREGRPLPRLATTEPLPERLAERLPGSYRSDEGEDAAIRRRGERVVLEWRGRIRALRMGSDSAMVDDRHVHGTRVVPTAAGGVEIGGTAYRRRDPGRPEPCPADRRELLGEYGWDHNVLFVRENEGALEAVVEWFWIDRLTPAGEDVFALPDGGSLYPLEHLRFLRDERGRVTAADLGGVVFPRRATASEGTWRIEPVAPIPELRREALEAAAPRGLAEGIAPAEGRLVDLAERLPDLRFDVRYATADNFLGTPVYEEPRAFLQEAAAAALARVQERLAERGFGLAVFDAYRPWHVTKVFWDATPESMRHFVADPAYGSRHNRGCAVDLTLVDLATGEQVEMPSGYDEFTPRAHPDYPGGTHRSRWHRALLRAAMESEGFRVYDWEWWHFDFQGWEAHPILNLTFEELGG